MRAWSVIAKVWRGSSSKEPASYKLAIALEPGTPLLLDFPEYPRQVAVSTILGVHLGYLTTSEGAEARRKKEAGHLILAKVIRPAVVVPKATGGYRYKRIKVLVWSRGKSPNPYTQVKPKNRVSA